MIKHVAFTMYSVTDMTKARAFYEGALGLELAAEYEGKWVEYQPGSGCLAITTMVDAVKPSGDHGGSIAFEVDDLDKTFADLKAKKAEFYTPIIDTPGCRMFYVADPDGNSVGLHQKKAGR
jgi:predicted enzyme related to lactoylglutathione lyase